MLNSFSVCKVETLIHLVLQYLLILYVNTTWQSANLWKSLSSQDLLSDGSYFMCYMYNLSVGDVRCSTRTNNITRVSVFRLNGSVPTVLLRKSRRVCLSTSSLPLLFLWVVWPFSDSHCLWIASCNIKLTLKCFGCQWGLCLGFKKKKQYYKSTQHCIIMITCKLIPNLIQAMNLGPFLNVAFSTYHRKCHIHSVYVITVAYVPLQLLLKGFQCSKENSTCTKSPSYNLYKRF